MLVAVYDQLPKLILGQFVLGDVHLGMHPLKISDLVASAVRAGYFVIKVGVYPDLDLASAVWANSCPYRLQHIHGRDLFTGYFLQRAFTTVPMPSDSGSPAPATKPLFPKPFVPPTQNAQVRLTVRFAGNLIVQASLHST